MYGLDCLYRQWGTDRLILSSGTDNRYRKTVNLNISISKVYSLLAIDGDNVNSSASLNVWTDNKTVQVHNVDNKSGGPDMFYWFALTK